MKPIPHSASGITTSDPSSRRKTIQFPNRRVRVAAPHALERFFYVKETESGQTLIDILCRRFPFHTRDEWSRRIASGRLSVNGDLVAAGFSLSMGQKVGHFNPELTEPSVPDEVEPVWENECYLAVYKPAPMPIHAGGRYFRNTLQQIVKEEFDDSIKSLHRLDSVTEGIVLFARTAHAAERFRLALLLKEGVLKEYHALVAGLVMEETVVDLPIARKKSFVFHASENGKPAQTRVVPIKRGSNSTLVRCYPFTGRTHQIRVHLREIGHPIIDDPVYGPEVENPNPSLIQNTGISLIHNRMCIPELGIDVSVPIPKRFFD